MSHSYNIPDLEHGSTHSFSADQHNAWLFRSELEIKRSRFIASLGHAPSKDEARQFVGAIKAEFPDATHNCWAYAAGPPGDTAVIGQSDDGEPHGTAGKPMLNQLLHGEVGEIVAVVTRYFGGIKLGTGGLVRAYQSSVAGALELLPLREKVFPVRLELTLDYAGASRLYGILPRYQAVIVSERLETEATFVVELPERGQESLKKAVRDITDGKVVIRQETP